MLKKSDLADDAEFEVTPEMERAFQELKKRLLCAPILAHPRFDLLDAAVKSDTFQFPAPEE